MLEHNICGETIVLRPLAYYSATATLTNVSFAAARVAVLLSLSAAGKIGHVPFPLVMQEKPSQFDRTEHDRGVSVYLRESRLSEKINRVEGLRPLWISQNPAQPITVIIPCRDNAADLCVMMDSLRRTATAPDLLNVLVVDNGTTKERDLELLAFLIKSDHVSIMRRDQPFNWSHLNNQAASETSSPLLVFANDDMEMRSIGWDMRLRGLLDRDEIGAVGARLVYQNGDLQHAGVLFGWRNPPTIHDGLYATGDASGPNERWRVTRSVSAVTGAFLATNRADFLALGGFDAEELPVAYSDIDYALKLRSRGKRILWTPSITLLHKESKTRGLDHLNDWTRARNAHEQSVMEERWGKVLDFEPSAHPYWCPAALPFQLLASASNEKIFDYISLIGKSNPWKV
jgi:O-antigen biosynthesis protein